MKASDFLEGLPDQGSMTIEVEFAQSEQAIAEINAIYREMAEPLRHLAALIGRRDAEMFIYDLIARVLDAQRAA